MNRFKLFIRRLIEPLDNTLPVIDRRRARVLATVVIVQLVLHLFWVIGAIVDTAGILPAPGVRPAQILYGFGLLVPVYILSRTHYYMISALVLAIGFIVNLFAITITNDLDHPEHALVFVTIIVMVSALTLPKRITFTLAVIGNLGILILPMFTDYSLTTLLPTFLLNVSTAALMLVSVAIHDDDLRRLLESERRYRDLTQANIEGVFVHDLDGNILDVNPSAVQFTGYEHAKLLTMNVGDLVADRYRLPVPAVVERYKNMAYETVIVTRDGEERVVELRTRPYVWHGSPAYVTVGQDITERKQAERLRSEYEQRYASLIQHTADAVFLIDLEGRIIEANQQASDMLGLSFDQLIGVPTDTWIDEDQRADRLKVGERLLAGETVPLYERRFNRGDGTKFIGEVNAMMVRDGRGRPLYIQSIVRDTTARQQMQAQQMEVTLHQERIRMLEQFIGDTSHHFRTPLTNLKTSMYLLARYDADSDKYRHHRRVIELEITRLERLLEDLLMITRLEHTEDFSLSQFDLAESVQEIIRMYRQRHIDRTLDLTYDRGATYPIYGDHQRLVITFRHLIDNALQYSDETQPVKVIIWRVDDWIGIRVLDYGIGINEGDLRRIFDSFYRSNEAVDRNSTSSGLGLAIVDRVIAMHRGKVHVTSVPDEGSTFTVILPVARNFNPVDAETFKRVLAGQPAQ